MTRSMTLLNLTGDTTIEWDAENDEQMKAIIQDMLDRGYTFFTIKRNWYGKKVKTEVKSASDIKKNAVVTDDPTAFSAPQVAASTGEKKVDALIKMSSVRTSPAPDQIDTIKKTSNIKEIMQTPTVAIRPIAAG